MTSAGGEYVNPRALRQAATAFTNDVTPHLDAAKRHLDQGQSVEYGNFTAVSSILATAYVAAWNFVDADLAKKHQVVQGFHDNLIHTAQGWEDAESCSTVRPQ